MSSVAVSPEIFLPSAVSGETDASSTTYWKSAAEGAPAAESEPAAETVNMTFIEDGEEIHVQAELGKTMLEVAHAKCLRGAHVNANGER